MTKWQLVKRFSFVLYEKFLEDECPSRAASLAYTTLLSIVPFMLFTFYLLSFVPKLQEATQKLDQFILNNFVASSAAVIEQQFQDFLAHLHALSWTNLVSLGIISALLIYNMVAAANRVWGVQLRLSLASSFGVYLLCVLIGPFVLGFLLLLASYLTSIPFISKATTHWPLINKIMLRLFPWAIEWLAFTIFNVLMPSARVRFYYAGIAGLVTMILFEVAKIGFVQYLNYFPTYRLLYGALATIPIFLVWIYVSWLIVLFGASVCYLIQKKPYRA